MELMDEALARALARLELSYRAAELEIGVSAPTLCRIVHGYRPDVDSYLKVKLWLGTVQSLRLARTAATAPPSRTR